MHILILTNPSLNKSLQNRVVLRFAADHPYSSKCAWVLYFYAIMWCCEIPKVGGSTQVLIKTLQEAD